MTTTEIRERPILFSTPMVKAILSGAKTQTRRVVNPQPPSVEAVRQKSGSDYHLFTDQTSEPQWRVAGPIWAVRELMGDNPLWDCPYGSAGDRLWVRESFLPCKGTGAHHPVPITEARYVCFAADASQKFRDGHYSRWTKEGPFNWPKDAKFRPSIHMPRWACRLVLEIVEVRVERLQDISEEDCWSEGLFRVGDDLKTPQHVCILDEPRLREGMAFAEHIGPPWWTFAGKPREAFGNLWDGINNPRGYCDEDAPNGWDANPWVWVVSFKVVEGLA